MWVQQYLQFGLGVFSYPILKRGRQELNCLSVLAPEVHQSFRQNGSTCNPNNHVLKPQPWPGRFSHTHTNPVAPLSDMWGIMFQEPHKVANLFLHITLVKNFTVLIRKLWNEWVRPLWLKILFSAFQKASLHCSGTSPSPPLCTYKNGFFFFLRQERE